MEVKLIAVILFFIVLCILSNDNKKAPYVSEEEDYAKQKSWYLDDEDQI